MPIGFRCFPDTPKGRARALRLFVGLKRRRKKAKLIKRRFARGRLRPRGLNGAMVCVAARVKTKNRKRFTFAGTRRRRTRR